MDDFSWWVAKWWIAALFGGALAFGKWGYKKIKAKAQAKKDKKMKQKEDELKKYGGLIMTLTAHTTAIVAMLYDRLSQAYQHFQDRGYCTMQDRHNCMKMFNVYKSLGGNDNMEDLMDKLMTLKIIDKPDT